MKPKRICIGVEFFDTIIEENYFYVDKTMFIKELLDKRSGVNLFTRPRRFGKTLTLTTLKCFFDIQEKRKDLFRGLAIMDYPEIVEKYQNKYPVIFLTIKDVLSSTYRDALKMISEILAEVYWDNSYLLESEKLNNPTKKKIENYSDSCMDESSLQRSLKFLCKCLYTHHGKKVIILLDEYDTPINTSLNEGYYPEMIKFMPGFMGSMLKSNPYLEFAVLTGVQKVSQESLFSSLNNLTVNGIMDSGFSTCFGFTEREVHDACGYFDLDVRYEEVKQWYNGYRFGEYDIYNPWSITCFLESNLFKNYWVNTGSMGFMRDIFVKGSDILRDKMADLITGYKVNMSYTDRIVHPVPFENEDVFWSLLLNAGYVKPCIGASGDEFEVELVNKEIRNTFGDSVRSWFQKNETGLHGTIKEFVENLLIGNVELVKYILNNELLNSPSYYDLKAENSYHMFIFGMLLAAAKEYTVISNQESGKGRADLIVKPFDKTKPAIILEIKYMKRLLSSQTLLGLAEEGMQQIEDKKYVFGLKNEGYENIYIYSISFFKKECEMIYLVDS